MLRRAKGTTVKQPGISEPRRVQGEVRESEKAWCFRGNAGEFSESSNLHGRADRQENSIQYRVVLNRRTDRGHNPGASSITSASLKSAKAIDRDRTLRVSPATRFWPNGDNSRTALVSIQTTQLHLKSDSLGRSRECFPCRLRGAAPYNSGLPKRSAPN